MSFIGLGILILIAMGFFIAGQFDAGLWGLWFIAFDMIIGAYMTANVVQANVISKNYRAELVDKPKKTEEFTG